MHRLYLPDDSTKRNDALRQLIEDCDKNRRKASVEWYIVRHYLQGCRYFESIEYTSGIVKPTYKNAQGGIPFKFEEVVNKLTTEVGRLMRLDTAPAVIRRATGLDGLRTESTAQAILDTIHPRLDPEAVKRSFFTMLTMYGAAGLLAYQDVGDDADPKDPTANVGVEVVPPWEIVMLPSSAPTLDQVYGFARCRWVCLDWLRELKVGGKTLPGLADAADVDLQVRWIKAGTDYTGAEGSPTGSPSAAGAAGSQPDHRNPAITGKKEDPVRDAVAWVRLQEVWCRYRNGRMRAYDIRAGNKLLLTKEYKNNTEAPAMPLGMAVRGEGIGQYGRSYIMPLISVNAEIEAALLNLFRNARDFDFFGMVGIPQSWGVSWDDLKAMKPGGRRFFFLERDPMRPAESVEHIQPATSGTLPVQIGQLGMSVLDRLSQQPEIITQGTAPGRVDSTPALNFLYQASTLPLGGLASSIASAYGVVYKALLQYARKWDSFYLNVAALADDSIIGLAIKGGRTGGSIQLDTSAVPDPVSLDVGISSQNPVNKDTRKQELYMLLQGGLIAPEQFRLTARLEKLDFPLLNDTEWQNYRRAVLRNIIIFNDGITPGELSVKEGLSDFDNAAIHLMVVGRLMASPEFALASIPVQETFSKLIQTLQAKTGKFPDNMTYPDEQAQLNAEAGGAAPGSPAGSGSAAGGGIPPEIAAMMGGGGAQGGPQSGMEQMIAQAMNGVGGAGRPGPRR